MDVNVVAVIIALVGSGGIGAISKTIFDAIVLARKGVSGKEDERAKSIIAARDHAIALADIAEKKADDAEAAADRERTKRIRWQEEAARLRVRLINRGEDPGAYPEFDDTDPAR